MRRYNLIGPQVRRLRYQRGWTQQTLAVKLQIVGLDVSRSTVAKIEARLMQVEDFELFYFTNVFKVGLEQLFPPIDPHHPEIHETLANHMHGWL